MTSLANTVVGSTAAALGGGLIAAVKHLWNKQKAQAERQQAIEDGVKALLFDKILKCCLDCEAKESASVKDRENLEMLYNSYHALNGNGTGTDLYNMVKALPLN
jgi:hypothetical protein